MSRRRNKQNRMNHNMTIIPHTEHIAERKEQHWEDLAGLYEAIRNALLEMVHAMHGFLSVPEIRLELSKNPDNVILTRGFEADVNTFSTNLKNIYNKHEHLKGVITDDDVILQLKIFNEYMELKETMDQLILPTYASISNAISKLDIVKEFAK